MTTLDFRKRLMIYLGFILTVVECTLLVLLFISALTKIILCLCLCLSTLPLKGRVQNSPSCDAHLSFVPNLGAAFSLCAAFSMVPIATSSTPRLHLVCLEERFPPSLNG